MSVPYADLHLQYQTIKEDIDAAIAAVIRDSAFIRGTYVDAFESAFAAAMDGQTLCFMRQRDRRAFYCYGGPGR
jgi:dTDP-4-amino-4,6-dideoxygalactose transaminase